MSVDGVIGFSSPHFWKHAGNLTVGTLHVQISPNANYQKVLSKVSKIFKSKGVKNLTIEVSK